MECPNCHNRMSKDEEVSCGMGNQGFYNCFGCGLVALASGEVITQYWRRDNGVQKGVSENVTIRSIR